MEKIIERIEEELKDVAKGKRRVPLREKLGEEITVYFSQVVICALQWSSVGYQSALRFAGMKLGRRIGEQSDKTEFSLVLKEIKRIIKSLRGGKVITEIFPEEKGAQLTILNSPLTKGLPNVLQKLCFFEEGFIEGYFDGVIAKKGPLSLAGEKFTVKKVSVDERKCIGLGDDCCEFLIKF